MIAKLRLALIGLTLAMSFLSIAPAYAHDDSEERGTEAIPDSQNQIIKFTDQGIQPQELRMKIQDSIVFFLNASSESLITLEVDYGTHRVHCTSSNMKLNKTGVARSTRPFAPRDFSSVCFPDRGTYQVKVYGLKKNPKGLSSTIIVE